MVFINRSDFQNYMDQIIRLYFRSYKDMKKATNLLILCNSHTVATEIITRSLVQRDCVTKTIGKEYATIYTIMAYLTPSPFRIKADRIFSMVQTLL